MTKKKVLFLCTGNSCRSQMAEAIVNHELGDTWRAYSAGTSPAGYTHPKTLLVLEEIGIHHQGKSKHIDQYRDEPFDWVITVCDSAAETCPAWLGTGNKQHISFTDPAAAQGSDEEILQVFRTVRDQIREQILASLSSK